jgi:glucosamine 6-phosphate synthetase-like amidotransferase/phosphosugar isomerase protein
MCGIITASGSIPFSVDKLNLLFAYNESRGKDSVGFYNEKDNIPFEKRLYKKMGRASSELIPNHRWKETNLFLGHVRAATKGIVNIENCHPFLFDNIIGCHNGTLNNWGILKKEYSLSEEVDMDSKVFFDYLNTYNDYKILEEFDGAANVLWVDKRQPKKLFVFKHSERTLYRGIIETEEGKMMYISSVETGLEAIGCVNIKAFKDQYLYEIVEGVIIKTTKIKASPRKTLSIERQKELNIYKEPNQIKETTLKDSHCTIFELGESISKLKTSYDSSKIIGNDVWVTNKQTDKTEYYYPEVINCENLLSGKVNHPEISHKEIVYSDTCNAFILNVYFDSGAFYEFRLGLPSIHYDNTDGKNISNLLGEQSEVTEELVDSIIMGSNMQQDISDDLKNIAKELIPIIGEDSIIYNQLTRLIEETENYASDNELLIAKIIDENARTEFE